MVQSGPSRPGAQLVTGGEVDGGAEVVGADVVGFVVGLVFVGAAVVGLGWSVWVGAWVTGADDVLVEVLISCLFGRGLASLPASQVSMKIFQALPGRSRPYSACPEAL